MITIFKTRDALAEAVAQEMERQIMERVHPVFCLASGETPAQIYHKFAVKCKDFAEIGKLSFVGLDEWVGIPKETDGSCFQMLCRDLFDKLPLKKEQIVFFETPEGDLSGECSRIDGFIRENPITFSLMGVGMNGHIGLNEPGCESKAESSVVPLSETTKMVAQKYFKEAVSLEKGITLGLKQIIDSERVIVVITGEHKREIVRTMCELPEENIQKGYLQDDILPVQRLLGYKHIDFYIDMEAAQLLDVDKEEFALWEEK